MNVVAMVVVLCGVVAVVGALFFAVSSGRRIRFGLRTEAPVLSPVRRVMRTSNARGED